MQLTLKEAANRTGLTKAGLIKAIKKGKISGDKDHNGHWRVDAAELFRVYPESKVVDTNQSQQVDDGLPIKNSVVYDEIQLLREQVQRIDEERDRERQQLDRERQQLESVIDDLRKDRDHWRQQATGLLTDGRNRKERSLWQRLLGSGNAA